MIGIGVNAGRTRPKQNKVRLITWLAQTITLAVVVHLGQKTTAQEHFSRITTTKTSTKVAQHNRRQFFVVYTLEQHFAFIRAEILLTHQNSWHLVSENADDYISFIISDHHTDRVEAQRLPQSEQCVLVGS